MKRIGLLVLASLSILVFGACSSNKVTQKDLESKTWELESNQGVEEVYTTVNFDKDTMSLKYTFVEDTESTASSDWEKLGDDIAKKMIEELGIDIIYKINGDNIHLKSSQMELDDDYTMSKEGKKIVFSNKNDEDKKMILTPSGSKRQNTKESYSTQTTSTTIEETTSSTEGNFVKTANEAYFDGTMLKGNSYSIKIISHKIIPPGENNEYSDKPIIVFWYDTMVAPDYHNSSPIDPSTAWVLNFQAVQDNNPNFVNKLKLALFTDYAFLDTENAEIKPGGTVRNAIAYGLTDTTTPITLIAENEFSESFGETTINIE